MRLSSVPIMRQRLHALPNQIMHYLLNLNLFATKSPSTNALDLRVQRISTRIYVLALLVSSCTLLIYTSVSPVIKTVTIHSPDLDEYQKLYSEHRQSLSCPCTKVSTSYQNLVDIQYSLHQVCNSSFVGERWIRSVERAVSVEDPYRVDFRRIGPKMFRTLGKHCDLINQIISDGLSRFYASNYVSAAVVPFSTFKSQLEAYVDGFISLTTDKFLYSLRLIRDNHQANALPSALSTNYVILFKTSVNQTYVRIKYTEDGCSCAVSSQCKSKLGFYAENVQTQPWYVPGMHFGCFTFEGLLQSTLECFFDQDCLDRVETYVQSSSTIQVDALNPQQLKRFYSNTTISAIIDKLMVEEWVPEIMYEQFYASCQPAKCSYTISIPQDIVGVITALLGLIGGLDTVLKLAVPVVVSLIIKRLCRRRMLFGLPSRFSSQPRHPLGLFL